MTPKRRVGRRIIGGVCYITHVFDDIGAELAVHSHRDDPHLLHVTLVTKGSFEVLGARDGCVAIAGDMLEWAADEDHGLRAITAGAVAMNVRVALPAETQREMPEPA